MQKFKDIPGLHVFIYHTFGIGINIGQRISKGKSVEI